MSAAGDDAAWMRRALRLAARGFTPPNPMVGCVIVSDGVVVGEGYHVRAGLPHAEANALLQAGASACGAAAYVTLEPCCHYGRTPPCADALITAGVQRVVVAHQDPNPRVAGKGIERLLAAGITVDVGLLEATARDLNRAFIHFHTQNTPYVTLKAATTLDGKIATATGQSHWITGAKARRHVHQLRARSGAVMTGIGTVLADDPLLTARLSPAAPRQPLRIILDSTLRTPPESRAVASASADAPLLIVTTDGAPGAREAALVRHGVEVLRVPPSDGRVDIRTALAVLAERGVISVLVEGGGTVNASLLKAGVVNSVLFFVAPKLFGGHDAPTAIEGAGVSVVSDAIPLCNVRIRRFAPDIAIEAEVVY
jgi:diaminohydroxyphosphoribosylaminopyrimidine deaminase/5-amino-6-(5-phosphoribosylamino)uracil reductase